MTPPPLTAAVMRGQGASLSVVTLSLSRAESISDTAIAAGEQVLKQLGAMKTTASQAMSGGLSDDQRALLQKQYQDQMATLQTFIRNSSFDETNVLDGSQQPNGVSFIADAEATQSLDAAGRNLCPAALVTAMPSTTALNNTQSAADTQKLLDELIANVGDQLRRDERRAQADRSAEGLCRQAG